MYCISIRGRVGSVVSDAFTPMVVSTRRDLTTLVGPIEDQAALHGVLARIASLGLELDEVTRLPDRRSATRARAVRAGT